MRAPTGRMEGMAAIPAGVAGKLAETADKLARALAMPDSKAAKRASSRRSPQPPCVASTSRATMWSERRNGSAASGRKLDAAEQPAAPAASGGREGEWNFLRPRSWRTRRAASSVAAGRCSPPASETSGPAASGVGRPRPRRDAGGRHQGGGVGQHLHLAGHLAAFLHGKLAAARHAADPAGGADDEGAARGDGAVEGAGDLRVLHLDLALEHPGACDEQLGRV